MKIKAFPNSSGSGQWRVTHPMKYLQRLGHTISLKKSDVGATTTIDEILGYDAILPQGIINIEALKLILAVRRDYGTKIILDFDDMIKVMRDNPHYKDHKIWDASPILQSFAMVKPSSLPKKEKPLSEEELAQLEKQQKEEDPKTKEQKRLKDIEAAAEQKRLEIQQKTLEQANAETTKNIVNETYKLKHNALEAELYDIDQKTKEYRDKQLGEVTVTQWAEAQKAKIMQNMVEKE